MTQTQPYPSQQPQQVLVVDDSISVRKALERILETQGVTVQTASSGEEALAALAQLSPLPALMIADVLMPGLSGLDLARAAQAEYPDLPVMLMSGVVDEALHTQAAAVGVTRLLRKPFTPAELLPVVFGVLDAAAAESGDPQPDAEARPALTPEEALLARLAREPGVLGSALFAPGGEVTATAGGAPLPPGLGMYVQFLTTAAANAGAHVQAHGLGLLQLDFGDRTLLLRPAAAAPGRAAEGRAAGAQLACLCERDQAPRLRELLEPSVSTTR